MVKTVTYTGQGSTEKDAYVNLIYAMTDGKMTIKSNKAVFSFPSLKHYSPSDFFGKAVVMGESGAKYGEWHESDDVNKVDMLTEKHILVIRYVSDNSLGDKIDIYMTDAFETISGNAYKNNYKCTVTIATQDNGLFFYDRKGKAVGCIIQSDGGTEFGATLKTTGTVPDITVSDTEYSKRLTYNGGDLKFIFGPNQPAEGYVSMTPIYFRDNAAGRIGGHPSTVFYQHGIDNSLWGPDGTNINGMTYYGFGDFCTPLDASKPTE